MSSSKVVISLVALVSVGMLAALLVAPARQGGRTGAASLAPPPDQRQADNDPPPLGEPNGPSTIPTISENGRFVAFASVANNLVDADPPDNCSDPASGVQRSCADVFAFDRQTGSISRVSVPANGAFATADSGLRMGLEGGRLAISGDGGVVAFASWSDDLVAGDANGVADIFVRDISQGRTERISVTTAGQPGNAASTWPGLTTDGRQVAFTSAASNLVPADSNGFPDIFVRNRQTGVTELVSRTASGGLGSEASEQAELSDDGRYVAFASVADAFKSAPGEGRSDVIRIDRQAAAALSLPVGPSGTGDSDWPSLTADGRLLAFASWATNFSGINESGINESGINESGINDSNAAADVFVWDSLTGQVERISVSSDGALGNAGSMLPVVSSDGRYVVFVSDATNLVPGDTNGVADVFLRDRQTHTTERISVDLQGTAGNRASTWPGVSGDGRYVVFESAADNLVAGDGNAVTDIFVRDRQSGTTARIERAPGG